MVYRRADFDTHVTIYDDNTEAKLPVLHCKGTYDFQLCSVRVKPALKGKELISEISDENVDHTVTEKTLSLII